MSAQSKRFKGSRVYTHNETYNMNIKEIFKHVNIFSSISDHEGIDVLESILEKEGRIVEVPEGTVIVKEGDIGNTAYIILEGDIQISRKSLSGDDFVVATLQSVPEKNFYPFIGEQSFISQGMRMATVQALTMVVMLELHHTSFLKIIELYPKIGLSIYHELCMILQKRLAKSHNDVVALFEAHLDFMAEDLMEESSQDVD